MFELRIRSYLMEHGRQVPIFIGLHIWMRVPNFLGWGCQISVDILHGGNSWTLWVAELPVLKILEWVRRCQIPQTPALQPPRNPSTPGRLCKFHTSFTKLALLQISVGQVMTNCTSRVSEHVECVDGISASSKVDMEFTHSCVQLQGRIQAAAMRFRLNLISRPAHPSVCHPCKYCKRQTLGWEGLATRLISACCESNNNLNKVQKHFLSTVAGYQY